MDFINNPKSSPVDIQVELVKSGFTDKEQLAEKIKEYKSKRKEK